MQVSWGTRRPRGGRAHQRHMCGMTARLKVAVADDEPDTREFLQEYLERMGQEVRAAADGRALVELCREFLPDLVMTDYAMPGLDGLAAAAEVNRGRRVQVVLITSNGSAATGVVIVGAAAVIAPPVFFSVKVMPGLVCPTRTWPKFRVMSFAWLTHSSLASVTTVPVTLVSVTMRLPPAESSIRSEAAEAPAPVSGTNRRVTLQVPPLAARALQPETTT